MRVLDGEATNEAPYMTSTSAKLLAVIGSYLPSDKYGGPVVAIHSDLKGLAEIGWEARVLTTNADGPGEKTAVPIDRWLTNDGYSIYYCNRQFGHEGSLSMLFNLPRLVHWADIVTISGLYSFCTIPALYCCKLTNRPAVWYPHGALHTWRGEPRHSLKTIWRLLCRGGVPRHCYIGAKSARESDAALRAFPQVRVIAASAGIDIPELPPKSKSTGALRLGFLGRLHPIKGVEELLGACQQLLADKTFAWQLTLAGSGEDDYTERLRSIVVASGLEGHVRFLGYVNGQAKSQFCADSDVIVIPSHSENFCYVAAEALAHGLPIVVSNRTPWQNVESVGCGLSVEPSADSIASAIRKLATLPIAQMGRTAREFALGELEGKQAVAKLSEQLLAVIAQSKRASDLRA